MNIKHELARYRARTFQSWLKKMGLDDLPLDWYITEKDDHGYVTAISHSCGGYISCHHSLVIEAIHDIMRDYQDEVS